MYVRFGLTEGRPHSCGGVYILINNIIRGEHFLQRNVHLGTTIPGPKEPSLLQLNHCLQPLMDEMQLIYAGLCMPSFYIGVDCLPHATRYHDAHV